MAPDRHLPLRQGDSFEEEFPGASRSATECASNLTRAATLFLGELQRRRRPFADVSPAAFQILAIVEGAGEPLPPSVIAERMLMTSGTMTSLLDTLTRRGLVHRTPHPDDRRMQLVDITAEGRAIVDLILPATHRITREMFATLSETEREALLQLLGRVQEHLEWARRQPVDTSPPPPRHKPARSR